MCKQRGHAGKGSTAALKTRLASMGRVERKRFTSEEDGINTSETAAGERDCAVIAAAEDPGVVLGNQGKRPCVGDLHMAFGAV